MYSPPNSIQIGQMDDCIGTLIHDMENLRARLASQGTGFSGALNWLTGSDDVAAQVNGAANQWQNQLNDLGTRQYDNVLAGQQSLENWFGTGKAIHQAVSSTGADVGNWSWDGIVSQAAKQTATDAKQAAQEASGAIVTSTWPILVVAAAFLILIIFVKAA